MPFLQGLTRSYLKTGASQIDILGGPELGSRITSLSIRNPNGRARSSTSRSCDLGWGRIPFASAQCEQGVQGDKWPRSGLLRVRGLLTAEAEYLVDPWDKRHKGSQRLNGRHSPS